MSEPRMAAIAAKAQEELNGIWPVLVVRASDDIMSMVEVKGTKEPQDQWPNRIFHNASYFIVHIVPMSERRYYDANDPSVTLELVSKGMGLPNLRKYTGPADKVIAKLKQWLGSL